MGILNDAKGRRYVVGPFTAGDFFRIKKESGGQINLFDLDSEYEPGKKLIGITQGDMAGLYEVLALYLEPQFEKLSTNAAEFGEAFTPEVMLQAQEIVSRELAVFFRALGRSEIALAIEKTMQYQARAVEMMNRKMGQIDMATVDANTMKQLESVMNDSFSKLPGLSQ